MNERPTPTSSSAIETARLQDDARPDDWPLLPTETDIYILPDGQVVIADLPAELADLADRLGDTGPGAVTPHGRP